MLIVYWPITIKFRIRKQTSKPQTNYCCCLWFSYLAPYWLISRNTITFHKYFWCSQFCEFHSNFLSQVIFVFLLFLGMVIYANEVETKEKEKLPKIKKLTTTCIHKKVLLGFTELWCLGRFSLQICLLSKPSTKSFHNYSWLGTISFVVF